MNLISFIDNIGPPEATLDNSKEKENFTRVLLLLDEKGRDALRAVLYAIHPPSTLPAVIDANRYALQQSKAMNPPKRELLFPPSGAAPNPDNFGISVLILLLRNICGLRPPATGWDRSPPAKDTSKSADIVRIELFRNNVVTHNPNAQLDDTTFESLWQEISQPLTRLGILQKDIDEIKNSPLRPQEGILSDVKKKR